jgi:glutamate dehydrogenase
VRAAYEDWQPMRARMEDIVKELGTPPAFLDNEETAEIRAFLAWAADHHFTFLGYRDYELATSNGEDQLKIVPRTGLGVLREPKLGGVSPSFAELPTELRALAREPRLLVLTKANARATVHRPGYLDYVGVKRFDAAGKVVGERRFVGLYTSSAYHADPREVPLLRRKVARVVERAGFPPVQPHVQEPALDPAGVSRATSSSRSTRTRCSRPRSASCASATGARRASSSAATSTGRFYSCLVYMPRESFNTDVRMQIQEILKRHLNGTSVGVHGAPLGGDARAHPHAGAQLAQGAPDYDVQRDRGEIAQATRRWEDELKNALDREPGRGDAPPALARLRAAFPVGYRDAVSPRAAVRDVARWRRSTRNPYSVSLYRPVESDERTLRLRVFRAARPVPLSASLPVLENLGLEVLDEASTRSSAAGAPVFIHDFGMRSARPITDVEVIKSITRSRAPQRRPGARSRRRVQTASPRPPRSRPTTSWVLRAYAKYLKQAGFTFSQSYIEQTLAAHAAITAKLAAFFHARFDPAIESDREELQKTLEARSRRP